MAMRVLIENEAGSNRKNAFDEETLTLKSSRTLRASYPFPYGFVIGTRGGDGEAVDCYVLTGQPLKSGSVVVVEPVGLLEQIEEGEIDHKILAALPGTTPVLDQALRDRLAAFVRAVFSAGTRVELGLLLGADEAEAFVARSRT